MKQKDALSVLLTGRGEHNFADLIKKMVKSKNLDFDMMCLKMKVGPNNVRFSSTMQYKQSLLEELLYTYKEAEEVKVYEDRIKQLVENIVAAKLCHTDRDPVFEASENSSRR